MNTKTIKWPDYNVGAALPIAIERITPDIYMAYPYDALEAAEKGTRFEFDDSSRVVGTGSTPGTAVDNLLRRLFRMKRLLFTILVLLMLTACAPSEAEQEAALQAQRDEALLRQTQANESLAQANAEIARANSEAEVAKANAAAMAAQSEAQVANAQAQVAVAEVQVAQAQAAQQRAIADAEAARLAAQQAENNLKALENMTGLFSAQMNIVFWAGVGILVIFFLGVVTLGLTVFSNKPVQQPANVTYNVVQLPEGHSERRRLKLPPGQQAEPIPWLTEYVEEHRDVVHRS